MRSPRYIPTLLFVATMITGCGKLEELTAPTPNSAVAQALPFTPAPQLYLSEEEIRNALVASLQPFKQDLMLEYATFYRNQGAPMARLEFAIAPRLDVLRVNSPAQFSFSIKADVSAGVRNAQGAEHRWNDRRVVVSAGTCWAVANQPRATCAVQTSSLDIVTRIPAFNIRTLVNPVHLLDQMAAIRGNGVKDQDDWLECYAEMARYRSGCDVKAGRTLQLEINRPASMSQDQFLAAFENATTSLNDFAPQVMFDLDVERYQACVDGAFEIQPITVQVESARTPAQVGNIVPTQSAYAFTLPRSGFNVMPTDSGLLLTSKISLLDPAPRGHRAYRVPAQCALRTDCLRLAFDHSQANHILSTLRPQAEATQQLIIATMITHGLLLDSASGAYCMAGKIARAVRDAERVRLRNPTAQWDQMSQSATTIIGRAVSEAVGAQSPAAGWQDFISEPERFGPARCLKVAHSDPGSIDFTTIEASEETKQLLLQNAARYRQSLSRLQELQSQRAVVLAAAAIIGAADDEYLWAQSALN